ncbi:IS1595 family transposase [Rodentibacter pneumotropicus]|uniref:IS1595 family transposase n=1 Tax=Rodentibacter pneumotropicus TaxID=758 RepID=A0A4S2PAH3_9PAST|nr:IS1595 family transposase [Rodentibacter pneumotropicus]THA00100.1 IS1595 family transposase [Rodentibacter pneumotropicus]THA00817.1 IS1595 family transposase [Rodentibacter pneumotropicus]THA04845.1 IS1595 family transposase [Rodentibacter pneumotropicus]THA13477.1 IS1595 family transposase [Rodentibacter pneumotropicus]
MAQHFLLSAKAHRLPIAQVAGLSDAEIFALLKNARWHSDTEQVCPRCGVCHQAYFIHTRQQFQCKHCQYRFSITTGTIFQFHKLTLRQILIALLLFVTESKGLSAISLSHKLNVQYKTAWVLLHKFRESLEKRKDLTPLHGEVHIDGAYVNYYIRPKNFRHKRIDRRKKRHQRKDKACVLVFRQRAKNQNIMKGADRSIVVLVKEENTQDILDLTQRLVKPNNTIHADENPAYDSLTFHYDLWRVNHSQEYRSIEGITNNLAESFFARLRRAITGIYHKMKNKYLMLYANEIVWREDNRRKSVKEKFNELLDKSLNCSPSRHLTGYWQSNKMPEARFGIHSLQTT